MATPFRLKRSAVAGKRPTLNDLQLGELALNTFEGHLFAERDTNGVGIGTTVALLTPWVENFGGQSIFYGNSVGIGTTNPTSALTVLGLTSTTSLFVTGVSTFVGVASFSSSVFVGGIEVNGGVSIGTDITTRNLKAIGITTLATLGVTGVTTSLHLGVSGITTTQHLNVTGVGTVATLGVTGVTTTQFLSVTGVATVASAVTMTSGGVNITGVLTASNGIQGIGIQSGGFNIATGIITALNFVGAGNSFSYNVGTKTVDINIGGGQWTYADTGNTETSSIFRVNGNVGVGTTDPTSKLTVSGNALITGVATIGSAVTISSGGVNITGVLTASNGIQGIGIQSSGTSITTGIITTLNFTGSAVSTVTASGGVVSINVKAGEFAKSTSNFTATAGQTTFSVTYTPNYIDVFVNGVRLTSSEYTASNGTSVILNEGANAGDIVDIIVFQNSGLFDSSKWVAADLNNPISGNIFKLNGNVGIATTNPTSKLHILGDALVTGIVTATGGFNIGIQSGGTNVTTGVITALNFVGAGNSFTYNVGTKTVDINIGGGQWTYTDTSNTTTSGIYRVNGNVGLGTTNPIAKLDISGVLGVQATVTGIQTTDVTTIDTLPIATYRSARFQVQITQSTDYQSTDLMVIHNGTTSNIVEYGSIATNDYLASFTSTVSGSDLLLQATMVSAGIATVKVVRYGVTI